MELTPQAIIGFTEIAIQLFQAIDEAVNAANNTELEQAWLLAQEQFNFALANNPKGGKNG